MKKSGALRAFLVTTLIAAIYYYFVLPPLNAGSPLFWGSLIGYFVVLGIMGVWYESEKIVGISMISVTLALVIAIVGALGSSAFFNARSYQKILSVETGNFNEDISQIEIEQLPILDRDSAERLGDRRMGEMLDLVSQFEVSTNYTQINIADRPVRTTPLEYGDFIKWFNNKNQGVPGYINVDMVTQNAELIRLKESGMKYVPSAFFGNDLMRHLRFNYPTKIFGEVNFEVDDSGNPYYIVSVVEKTIFMFGGSDIAGVIILNPIDGSSKYYDVEDVPTWVDRVYPADMITEQLNWYGQYKDGWWNSQIGQKGVLNCTRGYNYLAMDDDIWMYTGFTSVGKDESNVGFMLVNMRTKQTKYYVCPGAEEYSAMSSAQGAVENYGYRATFPLLINVNNEPTYLMSLKDSASLVKMYALVNVTDYQIVSIGTTLKEAFTNYAKAMSKNSQAYEASTILEATGIVYVIEEAVKGGYSYYYIKLSDENNIFEEGDNIYIASIEVSDLLPLIKVNDEVILTYLNTSNEIKEVLTFEKK